MKKSYVKPDVTLVRFELSEAIASCGTLLCKNHSLNKGCELTDDMQTIKDKTNVNFVQDEVACADAPLIGYCYFTSDGTKLMNS